MALWDRITGVVGGRRRGQEMPGAYQPQSTAANAQNIMAGPMGQATAGEQAGGDVMGRMKAGLGGYSDAQSRMMFEKEQAMARSGQNAARRSTGRQLAKSGISGGLAGKIQARQAGAAGRHSAEMARNLSLGNIAEQQKRLGVYGGQAGNMANIEMARRGFSAQLAQQEEANRQYAANMALRRFGLDPSRQGGGLLGAGSEALIPGFGGQIYKDIRY